MNRKKTKTEGDVDFASDILRSAQDYSEGKVAVVPTSEARAARVNLGLSQSQFASLIGVSVRTIQNWEQGHREPNQAAKMLLRLAIQYPEVFSELFGDAA